MLLEKTVEQSADIEVFEKYLNIEAIEKGVADFQFNKPFDHCVIDNFFQPEVADALYAEFPDYESDVWHEYNNPLEVKRTCNNWNRFGTCTYDTVQFLNSPSTVSYFSQLLGIEPLYADYGLNGGGWHIHKAGGKLNTHLDYSIHPKLKLQRVVNLIVYMCPDWQKEWGGELGLWEQDAATKRPGKLVKTVAPAFNRAVFFNTTQDSWHGLPDPLKCPDDRARKSLALYYLTNPPAGTDPRGKALFAPADNQKGDESIEALIRARSSVDTASSVYKKKD